MTSTQTCWCVLFVDLSSAYDRTVRQRMFTSDPGPATLEAMLEAGLDPQLAQSIQSELLANGSVLSQLGVPTWAQDVLASFHQDAWVTLPDSGTAIVTRRGVRQGDVVA
eukprot:13749912-Alexandrium_andersonii.AAC.1